MQRSGSRMGGVGGPGSGRGDGVECGGGVVGWWGGGVVGATPTNQTVPAAVCPLCATFFNSTQAESKISMKQTWTLPRLYLEG